MLSILLIAFVGLLSSLWLFRHLDERYLWQDEAATAILGERLFAHGKPLGYDGKNLLTMDTADDKDPKVFVERIQSAAASVEYFVRRRDFKADTTWTGHPWGQFVATGLSMRLFGKSTFTARLPFVVAGVLAVMLFAEWMEKIAGHRLMTLLAVFLLLGNVFWFIHVRQCRYYALSTLFVLAVMRCHWQWLQKGRFAAVGFVLSSCLLFQVDYGTFFPLMAALLVHALMDRGQPVARVALVFLCTGMGVLPFLLYYDVLGRVNPPSQPFPYRLLGNLFLYNQYLLPVPWLLAALWMAWSRWPTITRRERRFLTPTLLFAAILFLWVTMVGNQSYFRYVVTLTPLACGLIAWTMVRAAETYLPGPRMVPVAVAASGIVLIASPILSLPVGVLIPRGSHPRSGTGVLLRRELNLLASEILGSEIPDPNRKTVEFLQARIQAGDEIVTNYEDFPLMFYLDVPVRGGVACFRLGDRDGPPPRFAVLRRSVEFYLPHQWDAMNQLLVRCNLRQVPSDIPDLMWGNNPDPKYHYIECHVAREPVLLFECLGWAP